jgi:hypothetical protein
MKLQFANKFVIASVLSLLVSAPGLAATLVGAKSGVNFISVKNSAVAEVHHFRDLSGSLSEDGRVSVSIPLVTVETMIPVRNERMRELLFETASFPTALIEADVDMATINALASGDYVVMQVLFRLNLHGEEQMLETSVGVAKLGDELHVGTLQPLIINAGSFSLVQGIERLREVAGLQSISTAVPVTANLVFAP